MRRFLILLFACGSAPEIAPVDAMRQDAPLQRVKTIFTVVLENHDYDEIVGSDDAPYLNSLIAQGALATNYDDSGTHPSLPNYLYMISGGTQYPGGVDLNPDWWPYFPSKRDNLGSQMTKAGIKWRSYQEDMGEPCLFDNKYPYAPKHDPFLYFKNNWATCADTDVDYADNFASDLGKYQYMWITPNLIHDGHDPSYDPRAAMRVTDAWLAREMPKILNHPAYLDGGVLFITWDEAEGRDGRDEHHVPMIVLSPLIVPGTTSDVHHDHASYLATVEDLLGLPRLGKARDATPLFDLFSC